MDPIIAQEVAKVAPDVPFRAVDSHLYHTWARTWYSRPELFIQPESIEEIQKLVTVARRCRRRLVVVGSGHSPSDLTCTSAWLINLDKFAQIISADNKTGAITFQSGIRLRDLGKELAKRGLAFPNLGSIDEQSLAGVISTGTHGSSLNYGLLCERISSIKLVLASGQVVQCSGTSNTSLFRAALLSLGALGIIVEITFHAVPSFKIEWEQSLEPMSHILETWETTLWTTAEYTRVWWTPYRDSAIIWRANKTDKPLRDPPKSWYAGRLGYHTYHILLWLAGYVPRINPWVEWFVFGMQYGFTPGRKIASAVENSHEGLLMDCLYSQYVNEWAIPLKTGPEAITRLRAFLHDPKNHAATSRIPYSSKNLYIHSPIEVRVTNTMSKKASVNSNSRPFLDPSARSEPTLYLNAIMYRPYLRDPPNVDRYYQAFEWLMRDLNGKPHWAKNFTLETSAEIGNMYGDDMKEFVRVRNEADPEGMFVGEWHRRNLPLGLKDGAEIAEEEELTRKFGKSSTWGDGLEWVGKKKMTTASKEKL